MPLFSDPLLRGSTTIFGTVISVGGRHPTAKIDLVGGRPFTAEISAKETARKLGKLLYRNVTLAGEAWWYATSLELNRFKIREIGEFDDTLSNAKSAFASLRALSGNRWDAVDPDEYVQELRDDSPE